MIWQFGEAKHNFSQVVERASLGEPQFVTEDARKTAVIGSIKSDRNLLSGQKDLVEFIRSAPDFDLLDDEQCEDSDQQEIQTFSETK